MKKNINRAVLAAALAVLSATAAANPNLVVNGDFEAGNAGWTANIFIGATSPSYVHSGQNVAGTGCVGHACVSTLGQGAFIGQTIDTNAGNYYDLSFWVGENAGPTSEMSIFWNGNLVADIVNPANNTLPSDAYGGMVQYTFKNLLATAAQTSFEIHGRQDPAGILFDDVSVTAAGTANVPEPASLALLGLGAMGFSAARRRRKQTNAGIR